MGAVRVVEEALAVARTAASLAAGRAVARAVARAAVAAAWLAEPTAGGERSLDVRAASYELTGVGDRRSAGPRRGARRGRGRGWDPRRGRGGRSSDNSSTRGDLVTALQSSSSRARKRTASVVLTPCRNRVKVAAAPPQL
eukprot:2588434-Prymnesium_polylepis.1